MIAKNALASAIGLTVLFVHVEAAKVAGSIRGEEGRELEDYGLWKKSESKKKKSKSGSKSDKGGRCESAKSRSGYGYRRELGYYEPPSHGPAPDSKECKVFDFLHEHYRRGKKICQQGGHCDDSDNMDVARVDHGHCPEFDDEEYCHLIDHLHPGFNDMVCPCPYETVHFPYYYGESYRKQGYGKYPPYKYKEEKVCQPEMGGGYRSTSRSYDRVNDINRYGAFCSKALGFKFEPKKPRYNSGTEVAKCSGGYCDDHDDDDDCFIGCRKYVKLCCCKYGDGGKHYY